jgi:hypothetical protein
MPYGQQIVSTQTKNGWYEKTKWGEIFSGVAEVIKAIRNPGYNLETSVQTTQNSTFGMLLIVVALVSTAYILGGRR